MTGTYEWNPMPHIVDVRCSDCGHLAKFEFAEVVRIEFKKDVEFFRNSDIFEYVLLKDGCGHKWHGAIYFSGLHGGQTKAITQLPEGYEPENWEHSKYLMRSHCSDLGSLRCDTCKTNLKHVLNWPDDAFYSLDHKNDILWAYNRASAVDLYNFIDGAERKVDDYQWRNFLFHIPTVFKTKKARDNVVKKLGRLLSC